MADVKFVSADIDKLVQFEKDSEEAIKEFNAIKTNTIPISIIEYLWVTINDFIFFSLINNQMPLNIVKYINNSLIANNIIIYVLLIYFENQIRIIFWNVIITQNPIKVDSLFKYAKYAIIPTYNVHVNHVKPNGNAITAIIEVTIRIIHFLLISVYLSFFDFIIHKIP